MLPSKLLVSGCLAIAACGLYGCGRAGASVLSPSPDWGSITVERRASPGSVDGSRVLVRLIGEGGRLIEGGKVTVYSVEGLEQLKYVRTAPIGQYQLGKLPWGKYMVLVQALGYTPDLAYLRIRNGQEVRLSIWLARDSVQLDDFR